MFKDLSAEDNDEKTRLILEHELKAAIRIIGWFVDQGGGEVNIPHRVLGTDYRLQVYSKSTSNTINIKSRIHAPRPPV